MKKYINFIIESQLTDFLKQVFKNTIDLLQDTQKEKITSLINKINSIDKLENNINIIYTFFNSNINPDFKNIDDMKKYLKDDLISTNITLKTLSKKYENDILLPKNFYNNSNNNLLKKVFIYDDEQDFIKNINLSVNTIYNELLKNAGLSELITQEKINENDEIEHLQNTDNLNNVQDETDNVDETDKVDETDDTLKKIKSTYNDFQKNSLYNPIIKQLKIILKEHKDKNPINF